MASLTKALVTAPLILKEFGQLSSDAISVQNFIESQVRNKELSWCKDVLVKDLLFHRSGLRPWQNFWVDCFSCERTTWILNDCDKKARVQRMSKLLHSKKKYQYSDLGYILLGQLLEQKYSRKLDKIYEDYINKDLNIENLEDFGFLLPQDKRALCAPCGYCKLRNKEIRGEVHDENSSAFGGVSGHAGLFASGSSLVVFLKAFLRSQEAKTLVSYFNKFKTSSLDNSSCGWMYYDKKSHYSFCNRPTIGHLGFTGTGLWLCPKTKQYIILLTNRVAFKRQSPWIHSFRNMVVKECAILMSRHERFL